MPIVIVIRREDVEASVMRDEESVSDSLFPRTFTLPGTHCRQNNNNNIIIIIAWMMRCDALTVCRSIGVWDAWMCGCVRVDLS